MPLDLLKGKQLCLRCKHLYVETDDKDKKICRCETPVLCDATRVHALSILEIRRLPEFHKFFGGEVKDK